MSKGYWIVRANVNNQEEYLKYIKKATKVVESFNGKFLVRGGKQKELENSGYERTVIVQFNSYNDALKSYNSKEYQDALRHVKQSSNRLFAIAEGT
tara:strand:- start:498 stop:785 length:288 start_codon:yes stop_codon:yes gene_type:complete